MPAWESGFPNIGKWECTSNTTGTYNCFAFAAGEDDCRWDPFPPNYYYWPRGVRRSYELAAFVDAYKTRGFDSCSDGALETGYEKIVLYANEYGGAEHAARQLEDGRWTSKMGDEEDIAHTSPDALSGSDYGKPVLFMRRKKAAPIDEPTED